MKTTHAVLLLLCLAAFGCEHSTIVQAPEFNPVFQDAKGNLKIMTSKTEYTWQGDGLGMQATIHNESDQTYYAKLGDRFNSSIDQENLFVAEGSTGYIERLNSDGSWSAMPRGILIEGVRFVALRPQQTYRLSASLYAWHGNETGQFRIKVEYFDRIDPPPATSPMVDYSNVFTILK
jgi:hypothetical protein